VEKRAHVQTDITKDDSSSADQLREAFRGMAGEKVCSEPLKFADEQPYVTDLDFKYASLPPEITRFLSEVMPVVEPVEGHTDGSANAYDCEPYT
jgi:hypothetical protein